MSRFLGVDIGTQAVKALVFDAETRRVAAIASRPLELISRADGTREQMADWWLSALKTALSGIDAGLRSSVSALAVSGQQHGFVPLAADGAVLAPVKLWCDTATAPQCEQIAAAFGGAERCLREAGNSILPGYTASKILWLKQNASSLYERLHTILLPHDYINYFLTGERVMECGDASGTGLLDIRERCWHRGLLEAVEPERDLAACLPPLVAADRFIGQLRDVAAEELGLPAGTPVSCGGGDNMMAAIGTGNVTPGVLTVSLGTSGTLFAYADEPVIDDGGQIAAFCDSTGGWLPLLCTMNCTVATELTRTMLEISLSELEGRAERIAPGAEGVVTLPFYQGERIPNLPNARGSVFGLNHNNFTPDHLLRSAMEGAVYGLRTGLEIFEELGCEVANLRLTGGGSNSAAWRRMVTDIFNLPVTVHTVDEGAALGAALQACWIHRRAEGEKLTIAEVTEEMLSLDHQRSCVPDAGNVAVYKETYADYQRHVDAVAPLYQ